MPRLWLVQRDVDTRNLLHLTYATRDGETVYRRQLSAEAPHATVTAAVDVDDEDRLDAADPDDRERFAAEAERMAARHDPDDPV